MSEGWKSGGNSTVDWLISSIQHNVRGQDDKSAGRRDKDPKSDIDLNETDYFSTGWQNDDDVVWEKGLLISFNTNLLNLN